ncbi:MAG: hypothetical protein M3092_09340 [Actinomycetia bacterium]|nr:hypothetical protein [Actinomycetes bacterium]
MTTIITQRPNSPQLSRPQINKIIMLIVAIGIAAMTIATQPFNSGVPPEQIEGSPWRRAAPLDLTSPGAVWCCLGSKPAERLGRGVTDVGDVTSSVDNSRRVNPLVVRSVGLDPGDIDKLIGGTVYAEVRHTRSSINHVR